MTDKFFVDSDGLNDGSKGFSAKSDELLDVLAYVKSVADPGRIAKAVGGDKYGHMFLESNQPLVDGVLSGVLTWALAVKGTSGAVRDMSHSFVDVDSGAHDASRALRDNLLEINGLLIKGGSNDSPPVDKHLVDTSHNPPLRAGIVVRERDAPVHKKPVKLEPTTSTVVHLVDGNAIPDKAERASTEGWAPAFRGRAPEQPLRGTEPVKPTE
ncbi:hypothetical protein [Kutzneria chonburiensis]|uniref:Uncharacterized protein n=1 Tax=Kutzneria chonburiensis TaxID=1483604 RepID=A0ABV6N5Q0_9PSEU|nr:hypothetical protein [Kutzneria chonburiensis]